MPITLPQHPESMFSTYDPYYEPGYTGYIPKLRSNIDNIYGNATVRFLHYEPGLQKSARPALIGYDDQRGPARSVHFDTNVFSDAQRNNPTQHADKSIITKGHFSPVNGNDYLTQMNYMQDCDPRTSATIQTVEEIKRDWPGKWMSSETDRCGTYRYGLEKARQTSTSPERHQQRVTFSAHSSYGYEKTDNVSKKVPKSKEQAPFIGLSKTKDYNLKRQGKLIYRPDSGIIPNYAGFTPGQTSEIGKTWGKSTVNVIAKQQQQPFQWTSLF
ncbi:uncharacterized protein O3C94_000303 [Discoglossus pictus]